MLTLLVSMLFDIYSDYRLDTAFSVVHMLILQMDKHFAEPASLPDFHLFTAISSQFIIRLALRLPSSLNPFLKIFMTQLEINPDTGTNMPRVYK
ncbi:hypothetical protein GCM10008933_22100 [Paenibacillus motobuensis]|uniref:Uncharacterized protein n=1 Tax=Paenibacillus motobuensis TaxID=295324 RepID=A0ABP3I544_9BACL